MRATIRKWGNSAAVRLPKEELERLGLKEGDSVDITLAGTPKGWSIDDLPVFRSTDGLTLREARRARALAWRSPGHARR
jgi:hypothetical protein